MIKVSIAALLVALIPSGVDAQQVIYAPPAAGPIVRRFEKPPTPYAAGHRGIDIAVPMSSPVRAAAEGRVAFAGTVAGSIYVSIDHADGLRSTYSYLESKSVRAGEQVFRGQIIGRSGMGHDGWTLPPHLHFGIRRGSPSGDDYLDPVPLIVASLRRDFSYVVRLVPDAA